MWILDTIIIVYDWSDPNCSGVCSPFSGRQILNLSIRILERFWLQPELMWTKKEPRKRCYACGPRLGSLPPLHVLESRPQGPHFGVMWRSRCDHVLWHRTACSHVHLLGHPHQPGFAGSTAPAVRWRLCEGVVQVKGCLWNLHPNNTGLLALPGIFLPQPTNCLLVLEDPSGHCRPIHAFPLIHSALCSLPESFIHSPSTGVVLWSITRIANPWKTCYKLK